MGSTVLYSHSLYWYSHDLYCNQRRALPVGFRYSDIAIRLSNCYRNIGLTYLSDFNYRISYIVGVHILLLASLVMLVLLLASLNYFWQPCCCGSPFCCCRCDVPIVSATVGLLHAVAGLTVFARIPAFDSVHTVLAVLLLLSLLLLLAFLLL
jgi:hypothetical protein